MLKKLSFSLIISLFSCLHAEQTSEDFFTHIYEKGLWGKRNGVGHSGSGSSVQNAAPYMQLLEKFLVENKIKSVVDVGCGDWSFSQHIPWGEIQYTGFDVVKSVIERNKQRFTAPNLTFTHADAAFTDLPEADLMVCKDVMQHLTNADIQRLLKQCGKYKHCLITNDVNPDTLSSDNADRVGDYHQLDLTKPPFNFKGKVLLNYPSGYVVKSVLHIVRP